MNTSLLLGLALVVGAPIKEDKKEEPTIIGEWKGESAVFSGMPKPKDKDDNMTMTFTKEGKLIIKERGREKEGSYTADLKKKPAELDLIPPAEKKGEPSIMAIMKIEGDTLSICFNRDNKRPADFTSTAENNNMLITLKRLKKE